MPKTKKPKIKKIDVITVKLTCHIPHELGDIVSLHDATDAIEGLRRYAADLGQTTIESRVARVPAPEPKPEASEPKSDDPRVSTTESAADGLDIPERLRRTAETEPAAAE